MAVVVSVLLWVATAMMALLTLSALRQKRWIEAVAFAFAFAVLAWSAVTPLQKPSPAVHRLPG